jgi:hypothetical protein
MHQFLAITIVLVVCIAFIVSYNGEYFANINDKTTVLTNWFSSHGQSARYVDFIHDNPDSNIVEYARLRNMLTDGTINNHAMVAKALRV